MRVKTHLCDWIIYVKLHNPTNFRKYALEIII